MLFTRALCVNEKKEAECVFEAKHVIERGFEERHKNR